MTMPQEAEKTDMKKLVRTVLGLALALAVLMGNTACAETVWGDLNARYSDTPSIEYSDTTWRLRSRLTTILVMGTDHRDTAASAAGDYRSGGQADFQVLLVVDDAAKTITPIQINRDTMTEITVLNLMGNVSGTRMGQICLAHGFGDGREWSCELAVDALSKYLRGTPIDHYLAMSMDGIAAFNDVLGGVEVTLDEDFSHIDPAMTKGATVTLRGPQAEHFVRGRMSVGDGTNVARLSRQRVYLDAAWEIAMKRLHQSSRFIIDMFDAVETWCVTDMNRGFLANLGNKAIEYEMRPIVQIAGESVTGKGGFMEFYADEASLMDVILTAFYAPVE